MSPSAGAPRADEPLEEQVAVLASFGRDAAVVRATLAQGGLASTLIRDLHALVERVRTGVGAVLITEESLNPAQLPALTSVLIEQPSWSQVPVLLLLASEQGSSGETARALAALHRVSSVVVLQRPVAAITLVTAAQSAIHARRRQYEVRELIERERVAREQAETATRVKDQFLATVSHELRTPVSALLIWARLLEAGRITPDQAPNAITNIRRAAEAQSLLIEDLLDVSRMSTGKLRLAAEPQALTPVLQAAVDVVRPMADAKGVGLDVHHETASDRVLIDRDRIQQVVWNLLSNAVKFTPRSGRVCVRLEDEPHSLRLVVTDTGEGIDPALLPQVFERFRQGDTSESRRQGGLGLGLTIVHQLVELHGGTIDVESPGKHQGSTFTLRLPRIGSEPAPAS
jgi:signal transduction histidine kinase